MTLSTPVKIVALAALALALAMGGALMLFAKRTSGASTVVAPPVVHHTAPVTRTVAKPKPRVVLNPGLPLVIRRALERRPVAVLAIYSSRVATDRAVLTEARAGAHSAHAGFVAANVSNNKVAAVVATWSDIVRDPAVLIFRRPGRVVFAVSGLTDRQAVAQAALTAK
jgi:hypothetical protein